jgi:hypothetical protein
MFKMKSNAIFKNKNLVNNEAEGVYLKFSVSSSTNPVLLNVSLKNLYHNIQFSMTPEKLGIAIATPTNSTNLDGDSLTSVSGQSLFLPWNGSFPDTIVELRVKGKDLSAKMYSSTFSKTVAYHMELDSLGAPLFDGYEGWQIYIDSEGDPVSESIIRNLIILAGDIGEIETYSIVQEFFDLTDYIAAHKFVHLKYVPSGKVAVNIGQATTQGQGVDFEVTYNTLSWGNMGLDTPLMKAGVVIRVIYETAGLIRYSTKQTIGRNIVSLKGPGA